MPKILKEHQCDSCDERSYLVRLAEPQPVRVEDKKPYMALAEWAVIQINQYKNPEGNETLDQVSVMIADDEGKTYPGIIYAYNRARTLPEVLWAIGGEFDDNVDMETVDGTH